MHLCQPGCFCRPVFPEIGHWKKNVNKRWNKTNLHISTILSPNKCIIIATLLSLLEHSPVNRAMTHRHESTHRRISHPSRQNQFHCQLFGHGRGINPEFYLYSSLYMRVLIFHIEYHLLSLYTTQNMLFSVIMLRIFVKTTMTWHFCKLVLVFVYRTEGASRFTIMSKVRHGLANPERKWGRARSLETNEKDYLHI